MKKVSFRNKKDRLLLQDGTVNVEILHRPKSYWFDLYHHLLEMKWNHLTVLIIGSYFLTNLLFACFYYFEPGSIAGSQGSFLEAFFFSVQTLSTIGYGVMSPATLSSHIIVTLEAMFGLLGLALVAGLLFAKFSHPTARVLFSHQALLTTMNGKPCFCIRTANARGNEIVEAQLSLTALINEVTQEGERFRRFKKMDLVLDKTPLFALSWTIIHEITPTSPLWSAWEERKLPADLTVIATLVGVDSTFSSSIHARQVYQSENIVFDRRFEDMFELLEDGSRRMDYSKFHSTIPT